MKNVVDARDRPEAYRRQHRGWSKIAKLVFDTSFDATTADDCWHDCNEGLLRPPPAWHMRL